MFDYIYSVVWSRGVELYNSDVYTTSIPLEIRSNDNLYNYFFHYYNIILVISTVFCVQTMRVCRLWFSFLFSFFDLNRYNCMLLIHLRTLYYKKYAVAEYFSRRQMFSWIYRNDFVFPYVRFYVVQMRSSRYGVIRTDLVIEKDRRRRRLLNGR